MTRKKLLPDEYRKSGLVTIQMDRLEASLFSPGKLARLDAEEPGRAMRGSVAVQELPRRRAPDRRRLGVRDGARRGDDEDTGRRV